MTRIINCSGNLTAQKKLLVFLICHCTHLGTLTRDVQVIASDKSTLDLKVIDFLLDAIRNKVKISIPLLMDYSFDRFSSKI